MQGSISQPRTFANKLKSMLAYGIVGLLGIWMTVRPQSPFHDAIVRGETRLLFIVVIDFIWSVPAGLVLALLSIVAVAYEFWPQRNHD